MHWLLGCDSAAHRALQRIGYRRHFVRIVIENSEVVTWPLDPGEREPNTDHVDSVVVVATLLAGAEVVSRAVTLAQRLTNGAREVRRLWVGADAHGALAEASFEELAPLRVPRRRSGESPDGSDDVTIADVLSAYGDLVTGLPQLAVGELVRPATSRLTGPSLDVVLRDLEELASSVVLPPGTLVVVGHPDFVDARIWTLPLADPWLRAKVVRAMRGRDAETVWIGQRHAAQPCITVLLPRREGGAT